MATKNLKKLDEFIEEWEEEEESQKRAEGFVQQKRPWLELARIFREVLRDE